jgi:integrase
LAATKLSSDTVERLPYRRSSAGWCAYWHRKLGGFGLRVTEAGARAYVVRYRLKGSRAQRLRALGSPAELQFGQAYERAKEVLREAERGVDWFEAIKRERAQTLGQVWRYYEKEHLATEAVASGSYVNAKVLWRLHCASDFDTCSLADITPEKARDWHRQTTKSGAYNANRAAQMLRAAWNYGCKYGRIPRELENPFAAIALNKELARQTILEPHQFPAFSRAVNALKDPYTRGYFWAAFYTGCRRTELLKLTWSDVEILPKRNKEPRSGTIMLREVKGGEPRRVALSDPAVKLLEKLPRTDNPYVFAGAVAGTHLDPKAHWQLVRTAANLPELRLHDLRRSFGSWLGASGVTPKLIGAALGHKTDITSRVYVQLGEAAGIKRQLATAHAKLAEEFRRDKPRAEVVNIAARAKA